MFFSRRARCAVSLLITFVFLSLWGCRAPDPENETLLPITLTLTPAPYSGLVAIAKAKGFFKEQGLDVELVECSSGKAALEALLHGHTDIAIASDFVVSEKLQATPLLRIFASIGLSRGDQLVARKDRGINNPQDLEGKSIGVPKGTTADYNLETFLLLQKVDLGKVRLVDLAPGQIVRALREGEIDAAAVWDSLAYQATKDLKENFSHWEIQNTISYQWLLVGLAGLEDRDDRLRRLLRALLQAESYALLHKDEVLGILQAAWRFDPEFLATMWERTRLTVSLNQGLITSLENQIQWRRDREPGAAGVPNVLDAISLNPLRQEDPKAVSILR